MYEYKAKYIKNYDGDTVTFDIDLGFKVHMTLNVRLSGINSPEIKSNVEEEKERAIKARDFVEKALSEADNIIIRSGKLTGKYGRYITTVFYDGINLNEELIQEGLADQY